MVTKDLQLTKKEQDWIAEFKNVLSRKPKGIELVLDNSGINIYVAGAHSKHIGSEHDSFGMDANPEIRCLWLYSINTKNIIPYSEGQ